MLFVLSIPASAVLLWMLFYFLFNTLAGDTKRYQAVWFLGAIVDVYVNLWASILFLQFPHYKCLFLSARMDDLIRNGTGWRKSLALWIVGTLLEPFDKSGQHTTYGIPL
jgi:hypothetical protein